MLPAELLARGGLVLLIALAIEPLFRHRATARHVLLTSALCVLLLQPAQMLLGIAWRPALLPALAPVPEIIFEPGLPANSIAVEQSPASAESGSDVSAFAAIYLTVLGLLIALRLTGMVRIHGLVRRAAEVNESHPTARRARALAAQQRIGRPVALLKSTERIHACTAGIQRPVIVLPNDFETWGDALTDAVLRHELVHVRRYDTLWRLVSDVACAVHWFNPLMWLLAQRCRELSESACDDAVVLSGIAAHEYAVALRDLAVKAGPVAVFQPEPGVACSDLRRRIERLVTHPPHRTSKRDLAALAMFTAATGVLIVLFKPVHVQARLDEGRIRQSWQVVASPSRPFAERLNALNRATRAGLGTANVVGGYAEVPDEAMRIRLIGWLAQRDNEIARAHLIEVVSQRTSEVEWQAALAALEGSANGRTREFALRQRRPSFEADPMVSAAVIAMLPRSLENHIAAQSAPQPSGRVKAHLADALPCALPVRARATSTLSTAIFTGEPRTTFDPGASVHLIARFTNAIPRDVDRVQFIWIDPAGRAIPDGSDIVKRPNGAPAVGIGLTTGATSSANPIGVWRALACYQSGGITRALDTLSFTVR